MNQGLQGYNKSTRGLAKISTFQNWICVYMQLLLHLLGSSILSDCNRRREEDTVEITDQFPDGSIPVLTLKRITAGSDCTLPFQFVQGV
jgi:hypothetical protein